MGSISALGSTNRMAEVLQKLALPELAKQYVGRTIVSVELENEGCYEIKLSLKLDNGEYIEGPVIAEYRDGYFDEDTIDGCDVRPAAGVAGRKIRAEYKKQGLAECL